MRLKAIRLSGFKSFVDPTTVAFTTNMTGIVGPNGCGKSNTIDAVRWVMGESSARYLRGDAMTDVIFNGSSERKPVGKASVELVFDNSDRSLRGEYSAYNEISVRRQVSRDGQSLYFMNGSRCRRKDITDLFLGTGLGPRSYAIIEQGMISRLIEARPEDLRIYVEEAAGISRYKDRRRETEHRMRRTVENLERLQDIREELERQLGNLKRQAEAAEKYRLLKAEERQKKAQLQALKWLQLDADYQARDRDIAILQNRIEEQIALVREAEAKTEEIRLLQFEQSEQFRSCQTRFYEIGTRIARQEQKIEHQSQLALELGKNIAEVERSLADNDRSLDDDRLQQEMLGDEILMLEDELSVLQGAAEERQQEVVEADSRWQEWQDQWQQFTQNAGEPARRADVAQARLQSLQQQVARARQQQQRLRQELQQLQDQDSDNSALLDEEIAELELQTETLLERAEECREQLEVARLEQDERRRMLDDGRQRLQQLQARKALLQALQKAASGNAGPEQQRWLESRQLGRKNRLAARLQVNPGWELAVERVLGTRLQAVLVDDLDSAGGWFEAGMPEGSLVLMALQPAENESPGADSLLRQVRCDGSLASLMAHAVCVPSLEIAMQRRADLLPGQLLVTPSGILVGRDWLDIDGSSSEDGSVLARQHELDMLEGELDELEMDVEDADASLEIGRLRLHSLEQQRESAQREWQHQSQKLHERSARSIAEQARREQRNGRQRQLQQELDEMQEQEQQLQEDISEQQMLWQEATAAMSDFAGQRQQLQLERDQQQQYLDSARQQARQADDAVHQGQLRLRDLQSRQHSLQLAIERLKQQQQRLLERRQALMASQREDHSADLVMLKEELQALLLDRQDAEMAMQAARRMLDQTESYMATLGQQRQAAEQQAETLRRSLEALRLESQALDIRRQALVEQLQEEKLTLRDVLDNMPEEASPEIWQQDLETIGERIRRLGNINLAAIEEYRIQSERKEYLDAQNEDLQTALQTLESAVQKIDRETRTRFRETFDRINNGLAELFPKVFGGGHAWLDLVGDDALSAGVAIMARPPGKKNSTIHLLSGGEKALTAIALVFSIFQLNPAPFCMLDEVDAPLDDANVGRYARLVKAMSEKVQFIYITHNKIAMEMADQLMGVTMQEPGVSRLVSVDVEEAAEMIL